MSKLTDLLEQLAKEMKELSRVDHAPMSYTLVKIIGGVELLEAENHAFARFIRRLRDREIKGSHADEACRLLGDLPHAHSQFAVIRQQLRERKHFASILRLLVRWEKNPLEHQHALRHAIDNMDLDALNSDQ